MAKLKDLIATRKELRTEFEGIYAEKQKRTLDDAEQARSLAVMNELDELDKNIKLEEEIEARHLANSASGKVINTQPNKIEKMEKIYSLTKALREFSNKGVAGLTGIEKQMHELAVEEASARNIELNGLGIPEALMEGRAVNVQGSATEGKEAVTVQTVGLEKLVYPKTFVSEAGARQLTGLTMNMNIPYHTAGATSAWADEMAAAVESSAAFKIETMQPKRLATFMKLSKQFLMQDSIGANQAILEDMRVAQREALEKAVLYGTGTGDQPEGLFVNTDIETMALGTNGKVLSFKDVVKMETALAAKNIDTANLVYVTNSKVVGSLKTTEKAASTGQFLTEGSVLNGKKLVQTNLIKSNLTKGTATTKCSGMLVGNFSKAILATWGGIEFTIDNASSALAKNGVVEYVINSFHDFKAVRPENFIKIVDILTD